MSSVPARERKSTRGRPPGGLTGAETRAAIVRAATPIFARSEYGQVSMRDIAELVKITPPAIYLYFKDKRSLYLECCRQAFAQMSERTTFALRAERPAGERIRDFVQVLVRELLDHPDTQRLFQREIIAPDNQLLAFLERDSFEDVFKLLIEALHEATGEPRSPIMAASLHALTLGLIQTAQLLGASSSAELRFSLEPSQLADYVLKTIVPKLADTH